MPVRQRASGDAQRSAGRRQLLDGSESHELRPGEHGRVGLPLGTDPLAAWWRAA
jgi:hypothetical protein